jgi:hypothetical protein
MGPSRSAAKIDEVSLYNRAVSAAELRSIFKAGAAGKCLDAEACAVRSHF